jgi:peptidoglycan/LPS O-acetylase OafA/YrhL
MVSWHLFEKPINNLKNRFAYGGKRVIRQPAGQPTPAGSLALPEA